MDACLRGRVSPGLCNGTLGRENPLTLVYEYKKPGEDILYPIWIGIEEATRDKNLLAANKIYAVCSAARRYTP